MTVRAECSTAPPRTATCRERRWPPCTPPESRRCWESAAGKTGGVLAAALQQAINPIPCPSDTSAYDFFPAVDGGALQTCQGGVGHNSWYGSGEVDALKAAG